MRRDRAAREQPAALVTSVDVTARVHARRAQSRHAAHGRIRAPSLLQQSGPNAVDTAAPSLEADAFVRGEDRRRMSVAEFRGTWVVVALGARRTDVLELAKLEEAFAAVGAVILAATPDDWRGVEHSYAGERVRFPVLARTLVGVRPTATLPSTTEHSEGMMVEEGTWVRCIDVKVGKVIVRPIDEPKLSDLENADL